ncbi:ABC transporter permease [Bacteroidales bacterium OttesenSCG-928-M11]|nr:ABC transporter permease [Bacteroidales bacterium OttesenSCG-928-M11]
MNFSFYIARRYLFSKKSHNAINIISMIAVCGIAVATMATICVLSVLNGFQDLVTDMFSHFDPELKITTTQGKVFDPTTDDFRELYEMEDVISIVEVLEDNVWILNSDRQAPAVMKGVEDNFSQIVPIESIIYAGDYILRDEVNNYAVMGVGLMSNLGIYPNQRFPIEINVPKRNTPVNLVNPSSSLISEYTYVGGAFMVGQAIYDENYLLVPISLARELFQYSNEVSALEIKLVDETNIKTVQKKIKQILGDNYSVKNRYEQQEAALKMVAIEKWVAFLILCFIILIAIFNVIGSLSMLIVDKQKDIITLRNLGADNKVISRIFLLEGWMISAFGAIFGIVVGVLICLGQQYFGWLKLGTAGAFAIESYPVLVSFSDLVIVLFSVLLIGLLAVLYPVRYLSRKWL